MDPVVHFEMPYEDRQRMVDFYTKTFGWKANLLGEEMGSYAVMQTDEVDANNMLKETGRINGGFFKKSEKHSGPSLVIAVKDIQASMKKVTDAGCKLVYGMNPNGPDDIPGIGLYISFVDTEGNTVSMLQPHM
jgi:hypothetical protein